MEGGRCGRFYVVRSQIPSRGGARKSPSKEASHTSPVALRRTHAPRDPPSALAIRAIAWAGRTLFVLSEAPAIDRLDGGGPVDDDADRDETQHRWRRRRPPRPRARRHHRAGAARAAGGPRCSGGLDRGASAASSARACRSAPAAPTGMTASHTDVRGARGEADSEQHGLPAGYRAGGQRARAHEARKATMLLSERVVVLLSCSALSSSAVAAARSWLRSTAEHVRCGSSSACSSCVARLCGRPFHKFASQS